MAKLITPQDVKISLAMSQVLLLDVRRKPTFEAAPDRIPGSSWRDPSEVNDWAAELSRKVPVVVYCVHGHQVSQGVAVELDQLGYDARYLEGGIEEWRKVGGVLAARMP